MKKSSPTKLRAVKGLIREGEASGRPIPWEPEAIKTAARLRKALMAGLHGSDADNFDIGKVVRRLKKRR